MSLDPTFALTPRHGVWASASQWAYINIAGPIFAHQGRASLPEIYENDELYFQSDHMVADPAVDYRVWSNVRRVGHIRLSYDLSALGAHMELALLFGFDAPSASRILVYSHAGKLDDVTLKVGDKQFLLEIEDLSKPLSLFFIHAGGSWFFRGITGYVI